VAEIWGVVLCNTFYHEDTMLKKWFSNNALALVIVALGAVSSWHFTVNRISTLETVIGEAQEQKIELRAKVEHLHEENNAIRLDAVKSHTMLAGAIAEQEKRSEKSDEVIENNTKAFNKIAVFFARMETTLDIHTKQIAELRGI